MVCTVRWGSVITASQQRGSQHSGAVPNNDRARWLGGETVEVLGRTAHEELPEAARSRLRTQPGQVNLLLRIILRPIDHTLTADQANAIRNTIYRALHDGPVMELI